ncbi:MAG: FtsQ-type POTRA domain-containing protein [Rhodospirillales bacterium]|nr:FtsQ-type POTRA domain-containing protein [Rhodospirillales bacterium]
MSVKKGKMTENAKPTRVGRPRRTAVPLWRRRSACALALVLIAGGLGSGIWWAWSQNTFGKLAEAAKWQTIALSAKIGFQVNEILVVGRRETAAGVLRKAIRLSRGAPILAFDLNAARDRVEKLPWVSRATVERMLPDTILISIEERRPLAIWQHNGKFALIDEQGDVILRVGLDRFNDLVVVVGANAPAEAARLLATLNTQPKLLRLVKAAVWVGGRRWNLRLTGDIDVRLPEGNAAEAWTRLAEYERTHRVLERDIEVLDLRIPDRLIVRKSTSRKSEQKDPGRET